MYTKEDVFNIRNSSYELTELDERIYNETGYVLHSVGNIVEYASRFGTTYNQPTLCIHRNGKIETVYWYFTNDDNKDFKILPTPENLKKLAELKYKELLKTYWKD